MALAADDAFDRQWAVSLLQLTFQRLQSEYSNSGRQAALAVLKDTLATGHGDLGYASIA